ncbi:MAG: hybrid sensor histidine kinase/response regulator [Caldilineaceae bacterium]|nr:hybrid sensor histidine kinase/response regulator [Caldilineaceae bacterium]
MDQTTSLASPNDDFTPKVRVTVKAVTLGLAAIGALIGIIGGTPTHMWESMPIALAILGMAVGGWLLDEWRPQVAAWFVSLSLIFVVLILRIRLDAPGGIVLLVLPAALSMVMLGNRAGIAMTAANSIIAILLWQRGTIQPMEMSLSVAAMWSISLIYWATFRSIHELVNWSWTHYRKAQDALNEVRASRGQLHQTLDDLAHANRQLALMNRRLAAAQMAAEEARKAKAAFVANVSHEFRTPLNMIIGLSDLLIETPHVYGSLLPPLLLEDLEIVQRNSQHLLSMVNDVLDLSQIEADRLALHRDRVDLADLVEKSVDVVHPLLVKKQVTMQIDLPPDLPEVYCDGTRVRQVLVNLLSNAARHTEGGSVRVEVSHDDYAVTVCVRDTGPGIPPEEAAHIFEPFYRGTFGARRNDSGSGLGLSISQQFIQMHKGQMWLKSSVGVGSAFFFSLPLQPLAHIQSGAERWLLEEWRWHERTQPSAATNEPATPRILICDANPDLQAAFARFDDKIIYDRVESLAEAVEEMGRLPAQSLIINAASPRLLLEIMNRAQQIWPDLPVIGCCLAPKLGHALAAGALGQLLKPITHADLNAIVDQIDPLPRTVLVVDDDADARRLFSRMLTADHPDLRVVTASTGGEAIEKMYTHAPDLVLLDIMLPDMDGWQVLAAKVENETLRPIPTFLLSAQDPNSEPLATAIIAVGMGEKIPFHKLMRCAEILPLLLQQSRE